ncbi:gfo/Idh/MocA family oxidoreductase [Candidatus Bathyarchaeota archaeon]|nr:gfo/Idh/MocA family oxidoreductase [Candidatus Bathyarchaeota archaeon]
MRMTSQARKSKKSLKIGMVGLDTSHVPSLIKLINDKKKNHATIEWGYPGGSELTSVSHERVMKFTMRAAQLGVNILEDLEAIGEQSDAILLESCDGRQHLDQFKVLAPFGKPVFMDKPFTCSVADAKEIARLSEKHGSPVFSSSSLRYAKNIHRAASGKQPLLVEAHGPISILADYPGWFWYGVHVAEILYELLGPGAIDVSVRSSDTFDVVTSKWKDDRVGVSIGYRGDPYHDWGARMWFPSGPESTIAAKNPSFMALMVPHVLTFFRTGESPVPIDEMIEIMAYLEAVNKARETGKTTKIIVD